MMRLQRVGRKNDASFRVVVTDKRTGPKSDKHVDRIGSYNPKMNQTQLDKDKAKEWLSKGVQPSDTVYNILVNQGVIEGKKKNVLPRKSPIVDEEAIKRAEEEAAAKAEAEAKAAEEAEAPAEETTEDAPTEEVAAETEVAEEAKDDVAVEVVADEDDPTDHSETAEESEEAKEKEAAEKAQAAGDAEAD